MIVTTAGSSMTLWTNAHPVIFSSHFKGGAIHTVSVTIDSNAAISLTTAEPSKATMMTPGAHECRLDIVVAGGNGSLNRHYGIMIDVNGVCLASTMGDIPSERAGDTGHALVMIEALV